MIDNQDRGVQRETDPRVAEFARLVEAVDRGDYGRAATHRQRLYKDGWIVSPRLAKADARDDLAGDPAPRTSRGLLSGLGFGGA